MHFFEWYSLRSNEFNKILGDEIESGPADSRLQNYEVQRKRFILILYYEYPNYLNNNNNLTLSASIPSQPLENEYNK